MSKFYHLDSHIHVSPEHVAAMEGELHKGVQQSANECGWELGMKPDGDPFGAIEWIELLAPIDEFNSPFLASLAKHARSGDWIALQLGTSDPVQCLLIQFDNHEWSTRELLWKEWCNQNRPN